MIYINSNLRIRKLDEQCLCVEQYAKSFNKKTKEDVTLWKFCGYYGDIQSAIRGILKKQLFDTADEEITLKDLVSRIENAERNIMRAAWTNRTQEFL